MCRPEGGHDLGVVDDILDHVRAEVIDVRERSKDHATLARSHYGPCFRGTRRCQGA